ncbi:hypothetical protein [Glycomyces sp. YM15]|uniref:hypothetical protein n=1 Tax=Glycomyces sp. YM15 TaxID=2800446 RepID=UPI0019655855|nr:hypothetical protein [Glycomyces sp. YM15]
MDTERRIIDTEANDTDTDTAARVDAMADTLAAAMYWAQYDGVDWQRRSTLQRHAERLVGDGREPTRDEIDLLAEALHRDDREHRDVRSWIRDRGAVERIGHYNADLISQIKFMRAWDIALTAIITAIGVLFLQGLAELGALILRALTSLFT